MKYTGKSKSKIYKYVYLVKSGDKYLWMAAVGGIRKIADTEREAAIMADKMLIHFRKEPVNILVRKK